MVNAGQPPRLSRRLIVALTLASAFAFLPGISETQPATQPATPPATRASVSIAVVVNPANPTDQLTIDQLRRLFLAESFTYPTGARARVVMHTGTAPDFARSALSLRPERVKARWMAAVFAGEASSAPSELASAEDVRRYVQEHPDAIAFIPASAVDQTVKVVRLDGHRPGDAAYPIR